MRFPIMNKLASLSQWCKIVVHTNREGALNHSQHPGKDEEEAGEKVVNDSWVLQIHGSYHLHTMCWDPQQTLKHLM
jgi:hypothetical protein